MRDRYFIMERLRHSRLVPEKLRYTEACQACGALVVMPGLMAFSLASAVVEVCFPTLHAWPRRHRERRDNAKMEKGFRNKFGHPGNMIADSDIEMQLLQTPARTDAGTEEPESRPKDGFFDILPAEIRRQIMMEAFGDNIIHVDLAYRYPYRTDFSRGMQQQHTENMMYDNCQRRGDKSLGEKEWRWSSSICHHFPPESNPVWMSHGRRALKTAASSVSCSNGFSDCHKWSGSWPSKCHVGVMGWLLTCKQAYFEATEVLYSANTFNIESPVLLRTFQSVISRQMRTQLVSLTLTFDLNQIRLSESFNFCSYNVWSPQSARPLFPSLRFLRVALDPFARDDFDVLDELGLPSPLWADKPFTLRRLHDAFYPLIDELLDRIAPAGTEVTLTLSDWDLYELIDMDLVVKQGRVNTKLQRSEYGGLKCWRERSGDGTMRGYWIHIGTDCMRLDQTMTYDWERHRMYKLGPDKYKCTGNSYWRDGVLLEAW